MAGIIFKQLSKKWLFFTASLSSFMIWTKAVSKIENSAGVPSLLFQRQKFGFTQVDRAHRRKLKKLSFGKKLQRQ